MLSNTVALVRRHGVIPLLALAALFAAVGAFWTGSPAHSENEEEVTTARLEGQTRFHTAAELARATFDSASVAHIVFAGYFPDALAASYGAGAVDGPILPVPSTEVGADSPTMNALTDLGVQEVRLVGGEEVLSEDVAEEFADHGFDTTRIHGDYRVATAAQVATTYDDTVGTLDGDRTALLAAADRYPDALAAGPLAAGADLPLLLTPSHQAHPAVDDALAALDIERVVVVGGETAVSAEVAASYDDRGYTVERWDGAGRTDTAASVAEEAIDRLGFTADLALVARGDDFPDALAASVHGGVDAAPMLLTADPTTLGDATGQWLVDRCPDVETIRAIGGPSAVSTTTLGEARGAAADCHGQPESNQTYVITPQERIQLAPGGDFQFELASFAYGDASVDAAELALFPCDNVVNHRGEVTFDDRGDGYAAGSAETDRQAAWISAIDGDAQDRGQRRDPAIDGPGRTWTVTSDRVDCAVLVAWGPGSERDGELPLDDDGAPTVRFGVGHIEFVDG